MENLWLLLTGAIILGGAALHLRRRRDADACPAAAPSLRPLQVSCLAVQALGVQVYWRAEFNGLALVCLLAGVAGLGWLSLSSICRDEALRGS